MQVPPSVRDLSQSSVWGQRWDRLVSASTGIDRWCSRLPWQRSVDTAFGHRFTDDPDHTDDDLRDDGFPRNEARDNQSRANQSRDNQSRDNNHSGPVDRNRLAIHDDDVVSMEESWAYAFRVRTLNDGSEALLPLDSVWAFASPIVADRSTDDPRQRVRSSREIAASLLSEPSWRVAFLTGMQDDSLMFQSLAYEFSQVARVVEGESTERCVASLVGGVDGFLGRRPRTFRRNLRQADRHAKTEGVDFEIADHERVDDVIERLQDVERRSWKGLEGSGIVAPDMAHLYSLLVDELHRVSGLRTVFARRDGKDIGFILGGVLGGTYRGLQLSFVEEARPLSVGNLLQFHEINRLAEAGVETYDLGMDMPYKRLWSDSIMTTTPLIVIRP